MQRFLFCPKMGIGMRLFAKFPMQKGLQSIGISLDADFRCKKAATESGFPKTAAITETAITKKKDFWRMPSALLSAMEQTMFSDAFLLLFSAQLL